MRAGWVDPPSLDFHSNHAFPVAGSTNGLGSMAPPSLGMHSRGAVDVSVKVVAVGPSVEAVAMARQS